MLKGLRSVIYPSSDLETDKKFWEEITGKKAYFDEPFYVGFDINGFELGLHPGAAAEGITYPVSYWRVDDTKAASEKILASGATLHTNPADVGDGITMTTFKDKAGNVFGIIEHASK
ncbi:MAG: hypothetical protein AB202_02845 [Parcubacteria bacterium C7867-007]|nr:MAG: hypothetical protein AB202_02845 [Parcubacteria bacterium C7867-007]